VKVRTPIRFPEDGVAEDSTSYDLLAVATGQNYGPVLSPKPLQSLADRTAEVKLVSTTLAGAKKCVVVGGGPIGVKLAGDCKEANPQCEVILACRSKLRITNWDDREHAKLRALVDARGIKVLENVGELVQPQLPVNVAACVRAPPITVTFATSPSATVENVDLLLPGFAQGLNTHFVPSDLLVTGEAGIGPIATNQFGQSLKNPKIFGIGAVASCETDFPGVPRYEDGANLWALNMAAVLDGMAPEKDLSARSTFKNFKAPFNMPVGHFSGGMLAPRHAPMGEGGLFKCCGFPVLPVLCPCFCACPFLCGWCCESLPSGPGRGMGKVMIKSGAKYKEGPLRMVPKQQKICNPPIVLRSSFTGQPLQ
jgi:hypothetical protein